MLDKKRGPHVDVIHCDHGVPCVGYRLSLVKDKLNPEYANFPGREIGTRMKKWSCGDRASPNDHLDAFGRPHTMPAFLTTPTPSVTPPPSLWNVPFSIPTNDVH